MGFLTPVGVRFLGGLARAGVLLCFLILDALLLSGCSATNPATDSARANGIRLALRELGYIEGQNIASEYRYAGGSE